VRVEIRVNLESVPSKGAMPIPQKEMHNAPQHDRDRDLNIDHHQRPELGLEIGLRDRVRDLNIDHPQQT